MSANFEELDKFGIIYGIYNTWFLKISFLIGELDWENENWIPASLIPSMTADTVLSILRDMKFNIIYAWTRSNNRSRWIHLKNS